MTDNARDEQTDPHGPRLCAVLSRPAILIPSQAKNSAAIVLARNLQGDPYRTVYVLSGGASRVSRITYRTFKEAINRPTRPLRSAALLSLDGEQPYEMASPRVDEGPWTVDTAVQDRLLALISTTPWLAEWLDYRTTSTRYTMSLVVPADQVEHALKIVETHGKWKPFLLSLSPTEGEPDTVKMTLLPDLTDSKLVTTLWQRAALLKTDLEAQGYPVNDLLSAYE